MLDEPLAGLDPAQVQAVQEWLKEAGRQGAVLFSTHVLSEVEPLCQQALILNAGRLAAADSPGRIARASARLRAELFAPADRLAAALEALPGGFGHPPSADRRRLDRYRLSSGPEELSGSLEDLAAVHHWPIRCVRRESRTFAEAYLRLTSALPIVKNPANGERRESVPPSCGNANCRRSF
jgi:ABC-2 type transport system ATP-binding protein